VFCWIVAISPYGLHMHAHTIVTWYLLTTFTCNELMARAKGGSHNAVHCCGPHEPVFHHQKGC
jgi:hypothetical protein